MLRPFCTPYCMLVDVVACCCAKFETGKTFQPTTPNISFVPWSAKRSATMLDPFAQLFQHCWGHARSLRMVYKDLWVVSFPRCTAGPTPLPTRTQQLPTLLAQQRWELLRPFACALPAKKGLFPSHRFKVHYTCFSPFQWILNNYLYENKNVRSINQVFVRRKAPSEPLLKLEA